MLHAAARRGLGISAFVSLGNKIDVSTNDLLSYWYDDLTTQAVALYVESFGNPRRFARAARRLSYKKPILCVKSARSRAGAAAARAHIGAAAMSRSIETSRSRWEHSPEWDLVSTLSQRSWVR